MNHDNALLNARSQAAIANHLDHLATEYSRQGQTETAILANHIADAYRGLDAEDLTNPVAAALAPHLANPNILRANGPAMDKIHALATQEHGTQPADSIIGQIMAVRKHSKNP